MLLKWQVQRLLHQMRHSLAAPSRNPRTAVVIGRLLAAAFLLCFATGIYSHFIQDPLPGMAFLTRPVWLYQVSQGIHVTAGSSRWTRWSSLGLGYQGYYETYESLLTEVDGILSRSAKELRSVAERMVAASYDFQATEDQVAQELGELSKQVEKDLATHT